MTKYEKRGPKKHSSNILFIKKTRHHFFWSFENIFASNEDIVILIGTFVVSFTLPSKKGSYENTAIFHKFGDSH